MDQAVFSLSKPDGSADPVAVAKYLARDPRRAKALAHLNRCMQLAARLAADAAFADLSGANPPRLPSGGSPLAPRRRAMTCRSMSFSDAMRRICCMTDPRVIDCQRVRRDVPTTIWVICWSMAAAKIVLATSSPCTVCQVPPTAFTSSSSSAVLPGLVLGVARDDVDRDQGRLDAGGDARRPPDHRGVPRRPGHGHHDPLGRLPQLAARPLERRYSSSSSSVSSATKRSESSRKAARFSARKNPFSAAGTLLSG